MSDPPRARWAYKFEDISRFGSGLEISSKELCRCANLVLNEYKPTDPIEFHDAIPLLLYARMRIIGCDELICLQVLRHFKDALARFSREILPSFQGKESAPIRAGVFSLIYMDRGLRYAFFEPEGDELRMLDIEKDEWVDKPEYQPEGQFSIFLSPIAGKLFRASQTGEQQPLDFRSGEAASGSRL